MSVDSAIDIVTQTARGLERAHEAGIIHRDIKPSNLVITPRGEVKIIDFGLAKLAGQTRLTKTGSTLGTVAYMSPEQVQAQPVDHRTDIWSLGVVLYEMLTGKLPFGGDYEAAMLYGIVSEKPEPLMQHRVEASEGLQRIIDKALAKNPEARYQQIGELLADLTAEKRGAAELIKPIAKPKRSQPQPLKMVFAAAAILSAVLISLYLFNRQPSLQILPTHKQVTFVGDADYPAISPDGQFIAYVIGEEGVEQKVMVQDMAGGEPLKIYQANSCFDLRWSPDGAELMVTAQVANSLETYIIRRFGGGSRVIPAAKFQCWSPDGSQIASTAESEKWIRITSKSTGEIVPLSLHGSFTWSYDTDWSPLGNRLLFLTRDPKRYAIWTIKIDGSQQQKVVEDSLALFSPRWSADGKAIYYVQSEGQSKSLRKVAVAPKSGKADGPAITVLTGLPFGAYFTLSVNNKHLLYTRETQFSNLWLITLKGDGKGRTFETKQLTAGTSWAFDPAISPDCSRIAFSIGIPPQANLFVMPIKGGQVQQLTFFNSYNVGPVWSPDGKEIAFGSTQNGKPEVWRINANGGAPRPFMKSELSENSFSLTWSPGASILYQRPGNQNFHLLDPQTDEEKPLLEQPDGWIFFPQYSPDTKSVAVFWNRLSKKDEIMAGLWLVSIKDSSQVLLSRGIIQPLKWSADGKWIYAWEGGKKSTEILKIPITGGQPQTVVTLPFDDFIAIEMSPNEKQIVCAVQEKQSDVWIVENFDPESGLDKSVAVPDFPEMKQLTFLQKGLTLSMKKKYTEAEEIFRHGLELNPKHVELLNQLGWSLNNQRKYPEAEEIFREGLNLNAKHVELLNGLGWGLQWQMKYAEAKEVFLKGLAINPKHGGILNGLGVNCIALANYDAAQQYFEKHMMEVNPQDLIQIQIQWQLGNIKFLNKNYPAAERYFRDVLAIDSTYVLAHGTLGYLFAEQKRFDEAKAAAQKAVSIDPNFENNNLMAWVLVTSELDIDRGIVLAEKAGVSKPDEWAYLVKIYPYIMIPEHTLGLAYLKKGEYEKAVQYLEQATAFAPERENIKVDLQLAWQKLQGR